MSTKIMFLSYLLNIGYNNLYNKKEFNMKRKIKKVLTLEEVELTDRYFRAANYLSAAQLYLLDNPLLKEELKPEHIKKKIVGHWGTTREFISFKTLNIKNPLKNGYFFVKFHPFILRNLW